ncbi:phosphodiester glycosidase family protein [Taibaiella helva]|uniref:phosphodiester glycosidase family protein n=1 Tax=Taibaiella helva TaxID=2301235 RepID=UPI000E56D7A5|nr:phosphodiester glycosidase family protein [Taibaiella helva]
MYKSFSLLFLLLQVLLVHARISDAEMISFTPSAGQQLKLYWKDDQGRPIGSLGRLKAYTEAKKQKLVFAMNGGMYMEDRNPLGLFIQEGKTLKTRNTRKGYGNFYLSPNGVFYITNDGKGFVCTTNEFIPRKDIRYATQSGPMLVVKGKIHKAFTKGSANLNVRNGVGILPDGRMLFAMSKKEVSFNDFAEYFLRKGCRNALFLDGFVSRTYLPAMSWLQTDGYFGVIIGAIE